MASVNYRGLKFPDIINKNLGSVNVVSGVEKVESNMRLILSVERGSLIMEPTLGVNIRRLLFEPNDSILGDLLTIEVKESIESQLPVEVNKVGVNRQGEVLYMTIYYRMIQDTISRELTIEVS